MLVLRSDRTFQNAKRELDWVSALDTGEARRLAHELLTTEHCRTTPATSSNPGVNDLPPLVKDLLSTYERVELQAGKTSVVVGSECIARVRRANMVRIGTYEERRPGKETAQWDVCLRPPDETVLYARIDPTTGRVHTMSQFKSIYHLLLTGNLSMLRDNPLDRSTRHDPPVSTK